MNGSPVIVPAEVFEALATGGGDVGTALRSGQLSKRILLLDAVVEGATEWTAADRHDHDSRHVHEAWQLLASARRANRHAADQVIMQPRVGAWAEHCLRQFHNCRTVLEGTRTPRQPGERGERGEPGELGALAASAAFAAGLDFDVRLSTSCQVTTFPGFGVADIDWSSRQLRARGRAGAPTIELSDGIRSIEIDLRSQAGHPPGWRPFRRLSAEHDGLRFDVGLDDVDPLRDPGGLGASGRLSTREVASWQETLDEAWRLLVTHHRNSATAIASGLAYLVPIQASHRAPELSATSADSFGAVCLTKPRDSLAFASALIHEFQHTKLSALLDLVPLLDSGNDTDCDEDSGGSRGEPGLFYAPWRADARPLRGLLQGTYAFLGLTVFMEVQRRVGDPALRRFAEFEFARFREQVWRASGSIAASEAMTTAGAQFIEAMKHRIQGLRAIPVDGGVSDWAAQANADHETTWRLANLKCDEEQVAEQVRAFVAGRPCPVVPSTVRPKVVATTTKFRPSPRLAITYRRLTDGTAFGALTESEDQDARKAPQLSAATQADIQLVAREDPGGAVDLYRLQVVAEPERLDFWAGLSLAARGSAMHHDDPLVTRPELVWHLHRDLRERTGHSADPVDLATWLAGGTRRPPNPPAYSGDGSKTKSTLTPESASITSG